MTSHTLTATEEEQQLAAQILLMTNCHQTEVLSADAAIDIFKRSGLSFVILRDIWNIADANGSGDLTKDELAVAIRLMGWVQAGEALHDSLLDKAGPLPTLEGITDVVRKKPSSVHAERYPPINLDDVRNFKRIFLKAGPNDGFLDGQKVMDSFMTSNLSYDDIWKIKKLIDQHSRGSLDFREFSLGMFLIQALQSCLISSVPSSFPHELFRQFPDLSQVVELSRQSTYMSPPTRPTPPLPGPSSPPAVSPPPLLSHGSRSLSEEGEQNEPLWEILPFEKRESDKQFADVDQDQKGYIEGDNAARFMLSFGLPPEDLSRIWTLADLDKNNRLTKDGFAVAVHLIRQRLGGKDIPETLPTSLIPPSPRHSTSPKSYIMPSTSPSLLAKSKPPPPPPKRVRSTSTTKGLNGIVTGPIPPPSPLDKPPNNFMPSLSPMPSSNHLRSRSSSSILITDAATLAKHHTPSLSEPISSPFEDSNPSASSFSGQASSGQHTPVLSPSPRPPDTVSVEVLEGFKKETARLTLQVEGLLSQLTVQNKLRDSNEALRSENDRLTAELRDMERTVNEVLSASDMNGSQDAQAVDRLTAELANKEVQYENMERMLAVVTQNEEEMRAALRESQSALTKAKNETDDLKRTLTSQNEEIVELKSRLTDMGKAISSEQTSTTNNRELRVLIRDVTKENDSLKSQVRDMQKSMEGLLLSTKFHAKYDEVERENKRLRQSVQELELIAAAQMQSSGNGNGNGNGNGSGSARGRGNGGGGGGSSSSAFSGRGTESVTRENDQLKTQLRDGQRALADMRSANETKLVEMQQQIDSLTHENNRLKIDVAASSVGSGRRGQGSREENVPPPAYDDAFVIPP